MPEALRRATTCAWAPTRTTRSSWPSTASSSASAGRAGGSRVVVTNGAGSARTDIYADFTNEDMVRVRVKEQRKAATIGEYACQIQLMHRVAT